MVNNVLKISVQELVEVFRSSVMGLIPNMRRVAILNNSLEGHDSWDAISETLFKEIITESIRGGLRLSDQDDFSLPLYGFRNESYSNSSFIFVHNRSDENLGDLVLLDFVLNSENRLDLVNVGLLSNDYKLVKELSVSFNDLEFVCSHLSNGTRTLINQLDIEL